jgi:hypothetical protein
MKISIIALLLFVLCLSSPLFGQGSTLPQKCYKGNTHTHTANSDGDSPPYEVAKWYREAGYNFVVITDHEFITNVSPLNNLLGKVGSFLVISGQEVTDSYGGKPYHTNGLGLTKVVMPSKVPGGVETLQKNIDAIRTASGIPQLNHPNFGWALSPGEINRLKNFRLMEIHNGHPLVNNLGGGGSPSSEQIWDELLSAGKVIYGIADDDSHTFKIPGDLSKALPGQAWVCVRANELTPQAILESLDNGNFYASTGVEIEEYLADDKRISIKLKEDRSSRFKVHFISTDGKILLETFENPAIYTFTGSERYVRAKIFESNGKLAWTQPVFVSAK